MDCSQCGKEIDVNIGQCSECGVNTQADGREITAKFNTAEILKEWEERAERARSIKLVTMLGAKTDLGRIRENNEDKYEFYQPENEAVLANKGAFYAVADGMGGHAAGQIASELALKTAIKAYYADSSPMVKESLRSAIQQANGLIYEASRAIPDRAGMGTTFTALVVRGEEAFIAQVGDSRCYRLRDGKLKQLTEDHSWVNEQVKRGSLSLEEAEMSPFKNVITRCLGNSPSVEVDVYSEELQECDKFLICSDGLSGEVESDEMKDSLRKKSPSEACATLVELALEHGGRDNITVLILDVKEIVSVDTVKQKKKGLAGIFGRG